MSQIGTVCFQKHKDKGKTFHPLHDRGIYHLIVQMSICVATPEKEKVTRSMDGNNDEGYSKYKMSV